MRNASLSLCVALLTVAAIAQQNVTTTGGSSNSIPKFSGSTSIVNSALSETNGNLTIGANGYVSDANGLFYSGNLNLTSSCCTIDGTHAGYGAWLNYNAFFNGSDFVQARGDLNSYLFTSNYHAGGWGWFKAAPTGTNGASFTPVEVASMDSSGRLKLAGGVDAAGGGLKHTRGGGCSATGSNASCSVTVSWSGTAFSDTNYTAVCTPDGGGGTLSITNKTNSNVTVTLGTGLSTCFGQAGCINATMSAVECMAMHD